MSHWLKIELLSDACFSGGVGFAGEVDLDVEQEEALGLPCIRGRTLKGVIVEECAWILKSLQGINFSGSWEQSAKRLFGTSGDSEHETLKIGNALLPEPFREAVKQDIQSSTLTARNMLHSLTDIRHQTKIDRNTKAHEPHSLRSTRLALTGLSFYSHLSGGTRLGEEEKALFAASVLSFRRGGLHRNRGWGKLRARILDSGYQDVTAQWVEPLLNLYQRRRISD